MHPKHVGRGAWYRDRRTATALLVILALNVMLGSMLLRTRHAAYEAALQSSSNLVEALQRDIARNVELYDLSLQAVQEGMGLPDIGRYSPEVRSMILFDRAASAQHLGTMRVLSADGEILDSSTDDATVSLVEPGKVTGQDFFAVHQRNRNVGLFVGGPVRSNWTGTYGLVLSRRISNADGSFAGVVTGTMMFSLFQDLFHGIALGEHSTIGLMRTDGTLLLRMPFDASEVGRDMRASQLFQQWQHARSGSFETVARNDVGQRLDLYTQVGDLPLVLSLAVSVRSIYADWWRQAVIFLVAMLSLDCIALLLLAHVRQELRRRTIAEHRLAVANRHLVELATTDPLTGLANRRGLGDMLRREWRRDERAGSTLSVLLLDVDNFKAFNDLYGHGLGDDCLRQIAAAIIGSIRRPGDLAARYGGEEFAVVLPATDMSGALQIAETLREGVLRLAIPHRATAAGIVSVSIGAAWLIPSGAASAEFLFELADRALYRAKHKGRNRVESLASFGEPTTTIPGLAATNGQFAVA